MASHPSNRSKGTSGALVVHGASCLEVTLKVNVPPNPADELLEEEAACLLMATLQVQESTETYHQ